MLNVNTLSRGLPAAAQRGLGLIELMVGITVGLIVTAGAAVVATRQITEHRKLMLEVQMQQDLRSAADLLQQDLRRAGYRGGVTNGVWEPTHNPGTTTEVPGNVPAANPYSAVTQSVGNEKDIYYLYAKTVTTAANTTNVVADKERVGIKLQNHSIMVQRGVDSTDPANPVGIWQQLTDPDVTTIEDLKIEIKPQQIELVDLCDPACHVTDTCPKQTVRQVNIIIKASAKSDSSVKRTLTISEKIRADDIVGVCPV